MRMPFYAESDVYMIPWYTLHISENHWGNILKCRFSGAAPALGVQINLFYSEGGHI